MVYFYLVEHLLILETENGLFGVIGTGTARCFELDIFISCKKNYRLLRIKKNKSVFLSKKLKSELL